MHQVIFFKKKKSKSVTILKDQKSLFGRFCQFHSSRGSTSKLVYEEEKLQSIF